MSDTGEKAIRDIYFDHNATTMVRREVITAMLPWFRERFGNASSLHIPGQEAKRAVEKARAHVAGLIKADPEEIIFTSGGTESDNIAIRGVLPAAGAGRDRVHLVTSSIEHPAVLRTCRAVEGEGVEVSYLPCGGDGVVDPEALASSIRDDTVLITLMMANNETGVIQPVAEYSAIARERGVLLHVDAVQGVGKIPVDVGASGMDLMSISAHKFYGPKGVGALYVKRGTVLEGVCTGGHHERGIRLGTENVPGIVGLGEACRMTASSLPSEMEKVGALRERLEKGLLERIEDSWINGERSPRVPNTCSLTVTRVEGEALTLNLAMLGFALSSGSACATGDTDPSHVLLAMGIDQVDAQGALRISLGIENTDEEIDAFLDVLPGVVERLRSMSPIRRRN